MVKFFLYAACIYCVLGIANAHAVVAPWEIEQIMDKPAPDFSLTALDGKKNSLRELNGKTVLINFWATWCGPCREEMPSLNELAKSFKDRGLEVIGISIDNSDTIIKAFLQEVPVHFPIIRDKELATAVRYKVFAYPTTFLLSPDGIVKEKFIGERDWMAKETKELIEKYLEK